MYEDSKQQPPSQSSTIYTLNDFPDDILTQILSFLPTKEAFEKSILSKRWITLCYSLFILRFDDEKTRYNLIPFRRYVDAIMFSPHGHHVTLKTFHLKCRSKLWETNYLSISEWIDEAKRRHVENLSLYFFYAIPLAPTTIFCCKTLVVLKLKEICVKTMFDCSVDLPLLKSLDLNFFRFQDMKDFMKLLSGCPILEDLNTTYVDAYSGVTVGGYFKPLSKLIKASIHLFEVPFRAISNVQFLTVFGMARSISNEEISSYYKSFPVFENLIQLRLFWSKDFNFHWEEIVKMLQNCSKLQVLSISKGIDPTTRQDWKYPYHVPECVLSHLTTCEIYKYESSKADFRFARYILQNARLLQVMTIRHITYSNQKKIPQFFNVLSSCPRISPTCNLSLQ